MLICKESLSPKPGHFEVGWEMTKQGSLEKGGQRSCHIGGFTVVSHPLDSGEQM